MPPTPPASLPAPPAVPTTAFRGVAVPPQVQAQIITLVIDNAPFAASLTRVTTGSNAVAFPTAQPEGQAWVPELGRIPVIDPNPDAVIAEVRKLAGLVDVSNEMLADSALPLTQLLTTTLRDSMSADLDTGLLFGSGDPQPEGVVASAPEVTGTDLLDAVLKARGAIADAGGTATTLAASGSMLAAADGARDDSGALLFSSGFAAVTGLEPVTVPGLTPALVYDRNRLFLVERENGSVEVSTDFRFNYDASTMRIRTRVAIACPDVPKTIRRLDTGNGVTGIQASAAKTTTRTKQ